MIAIKRLQSIMWILIVAVGALSAYLVSLRVATERNAVAALERQIYATRSNIRYLEVEFSARSTMRQLAAWNARDVKYAVPIAGQYVASEQQLAALEVLEPSHTDTAAPPVLAAMAPTPSAPVAAVPVKAQGAAPREEPGFALVRSAVAAEPARPRPAVVASVAAPKAESAPRIVKLIDKAPPSDRRAMRLAVLEQTLLGAAPSKAEAGKASR